MIVHANTTNVELTIGSKAKVLQDLYQVGFAVPEFVIVSAESLIILQDDPTTGAQLQNEITDSLRASLYAVRSAAISEDTNLTAQAGRFLTKLCVTEPELISAINEVLSDANSKGIPTKEFSVIVQEYVAPQYAGVHFTLDPNSHYQITTEYRAGGGEAVVGGESVSKITNSRSVTLVATSPKKTAEPFYADLYTVATVIEEKYNWPQDIEWVWHAGKLSIVQARPITTISSQQWSGIQLLDRRLTTDSPFYYAQDSLAEAFSQTTALGFSLLQLLYARGRSVETAYQKIGVTYSATDHFTQFGNSVFIDKSIELANLYPSLGYVGNKIRIVSLRNFWTTIKNMYRLTFMSISPLAELQKNVTYILESEFKTDATLSERVNVYVTNYSWLYLVGIKYAHIQKKLEQMVGVAETRTLMLQLHNTISYIPPSSIEVLLGQSVGNSVSYDDTSVFTIIQQSKTKQSIEGIVKALAVPAWKQSTLINLCQQLQKLEHLREQARWGGVRLMQYVRAGLADISSYDALPHVKISELLTCSVDQSVCSDRRTSFVGNKNVLLPTVIASFVQTESEKQTYGVSSGSCTGTLVTHEQLQHLPEGDYILVVTTLSPDLAQYLPKVVGVISRNGGLLSHMAIVAREAKVPVVISSRYLKLGSRVYLNGETGEVAS